MPAFFHEEEGGDAEVNNAKKLMKEAFLAQSAKDLEVAVQKAVEVNKEGKLDKQIEFCKTKIEVYTERAAASQ